MDYLAGISEVEISEIKTSELEISEAIDATASTKGYDFRGTNEITTTDYRE